MLFDVGVNLDPFFKLLWRHVFTVEILNKYFENRPPAKGRNLFERLRDTFQGESRQEKEVKEALDYLEKWGKRNDIHLHLTVDCGDEEWTGKVGFVPAITKEVAPRSEDAYALVCGPPAMIKFTLPVVEELGFPPERTLLSLEMRMKCGLGMCGRCNIGSQYVCRDGPVFDGRDIDWERM